MRLICVYLQQSRFTKCDICESIKTAKSSSADKREIKELVQKIEEVKREFEISDGMSWKFNY